MLNEEDPVHAAIPPGRTAGRTAARTAVAAADLHRPVPRRQGTRGGRRGARPACRAAAGLPAAAARSKISRSPSTTPTSPSGDRRPWRCEPACLSGNGTCRYPPPVARARPLPRPGAAPAGAGSDPVVTPPPGYPTDIRSSSRSGWLRPPARTNA